MTTRKFFSLINGDQVRVAPKSKIIKAEEFSTLVDAKELLEKAQNDAAEYRKKIEEECVQIKIDAEKAGFEKGMNDWVEAIKKLEEKIETVNDETSKQIIPVALKAAKKIVGKEIELNKETILDIVKNSLKAVSQHKQITIYVNKDDVALLNEKRNDLKQVFESVQTLSVRARDDIEPGGCVIETEAGIINAKLENQWELLEKAFEKLTKGTS